jgi:hypothetical protein
MRAPPSLLLMLCPLLAACETPSTGAVATRTLEFRTDTGVSAFFPGPIRAENAWQFAMHANTLAGFGEPSFRFARVPAGTRAMRFTWIRSFYPTLVVRVMDTGDSCRLVTASGRPGGYFLELPEIAPEDAGTGGHSTGFLAARLDRKDSTSAEHAVCRMLNSQLDAAGLQQRDLPAFGMDGNYWLLERVDDTGHMLRMEWSPDRFAQRPFFEAGVALLRAANVLPAREHELY